MSKPQLPDDILPYRLADQGVQLSGIVSAHKMKRLQADQIELAEVSVVAQFKQDEEGRRIVSGQIKTVARLVCQRCLKPMDWPLDVEFCLQLVSAENQLQSVPSFLEPWLVPPGVRTDMAGMIEDTLYLEFPMFPMHDPDVCSVRLASARDDSVLGLDRGNIRPNPFEQLASLTRRPKK